MYIITNRFYQTGKETCKTAAKESLEGVPTIILRKNNNDIEYKKDSNNNFKGDRSVDELVRFVEFNK